ncbi:MAG: hypothetical protein ACREO8_02445 [Luteimonas sp.]
MSATARHALLRTTLIVFALADVLVWVSFVFNQWFAVPLWQAWGLAGLLALPITMLVLPLVDAVLVRPRDQRVIQFAGDKIPRVGQ